MGLKDINLPSSIRSVLRLSKTPPAQHQKKVLKRLLKKAKYTAFGQAYDFESMLTQEDWVKAFQQAVPIHDYNSITEKWWHRTLEGEADVCWPDKVKYFALSSGTSESASKYIPITNDLMRGNQRIMIKQLLSLRSYQDLPMRSIGKGWLMLGGCTDLEKGPGYFAGDLSGITAKNVPFWFSPFYKPGKKIAKTKDWHEKIEKIVEEAPKWDIGFVVGVPAWIQMCMEKIIERYQLKTIHDIWPNLAFFVHGGVSFEPYKKGFNKLVAKPLIFIETYLASEGFLAYQDRQNAQGGMKLASKDHIFFEFVPFNDQNFDVNGNINPNAIAYTIGEVEEGKDYALLLSTPAGAWRYLIGDTIRFVNLEKRELIITGRTKHFLSLVGEHLSVDNMNRAIQLVADELNVSIPEFTVAGVPHGLFFAHQWWIASSEVIDSRVFKERLDFHLKKLNDDYAVERTSALKDIYVDVLPVDTFMAFLQHKGKVGGQHKFPRVMKGKMLEDWNDFLQNVSLP
jgi:hypothetical protein